MTMSKSTRSNDLGQIEASMPFRSGFVALRAIPHNHIENNMAIGNVQFFAHFDSRIASR